ncbi:MAG: FHA domain-containing protein [Acidobacteriota bacterium]|nr:FHA domain-containing protein [Acidobacteriota bacterium]
MASKFILKKTFADPESEDSVIGEYALSGDLLTVGSDAGSTIVIPEIASEQFVVIREANHLTLISRAVGTLINGQNLRREAMQPLASGDRINIGDYLITLVSESNQRPVPVVASAEDIYATHQDFSPSEFIPAAESNSERKIVAKPEPLPALPSKKNARNFADVLNSLRTEEDSFYFAVENSIQENRRIPLEQAEMSLGLNAKREICGGNGQIAVLYAVLRKDWSGIIIETQRTGAIFVNNEAISTTRRLRNGDIISFSVVKPNDRAVPFLRLHEPSSLVALESLLESRGRGAGIQKNLNGAETTYSDETENAAAEPKAPFLERRLLGYFNFFEMIAMVIGTLIGAVLIFLLLEFFAG